MRERIQAKIEELTKARDAYVAQANQQAAAYGGAIEALKALLTEEEPVPIPANGGAEIVDVSPPS